MEADMKYQGFIKKSRTLDAASLLVMFNTVYPVIQDQLPNLHASPVVIGVVNVVGAIIIAILRFDTNGPVGEK